MKMVVRVAAGIMVALAAVQSITARADNPPGPAGKEAGTGGPVKVFILLGQSNMVGAGDGAEKLHR